MRILHVLRSLSPVEGGVREAVLQFARSHLEVGDIVEVLCQDDPRSSFLEGLPFPINALGAGGLGRFGLSMKLWRWLNENVRAFDGVVMNGIWTFPSLAVHSAALRASKPYVIFPHGSLDPWFNREYKLKHLKKAIYWKLQYPVLRDAAAVLFTTSIEEKLATESFSPNKWKSAVVSLGIGEPTGEPGEQIEAFYRILPHLEKKRHLLFLARINAKKGCDLLLRAFAKIAPTVPDLDLVIAGPDEKGLTAKLQDICSAIGVSHRVHWPGILVGAAKWGAIRTCDAFVLPSHQENFGIAVVESLAMGRPVLISNQVNIWQQIHATGAGVVEEDTLDGTARLLKAWCSLSENRKIEMAAAARRCYLSEFASSKLAQILDGAFLRC